MQFPKFTKRDIFFLTVLVLVLALSVYHTYYGITVVSSIAYGAMCCALAYEATGKWSLTWIALVIFVGATHMEYITKKERYEENQLQIERACIEAKKTGNKVFGHTESEPEKQIELCVEGA